MRCSSPRATGPAWRWARAMRRSSAGRRLRGPRHEAEVAVGCALHDGLGARERDLRVEALDEGEVAVARQQRADLGDAEAAVHLRIAAARDVERQALGRRLERVHLIRVTLLPVLERGGEAAEIVAAHLAGQLAALLARHVDDDVACDGEDALLAELGAETLEHGHQDARLDLAAPEHADLVQGVGGKLAHNYLLLAKSG